MLHAVLSNGGHCYQAAMSPFEEQLGKISEDLHSLHTRLLTDIDTLLLDTNSTSYYCSYPMGWGAHKHI